MENEVEDGMELSSIIGVLRSDKEDLEQPTPHATCVRTTPDLLEQMSSDSEDDRAYTEREALMPFTQRHKKAVTVIGALICLMCTFALGSTIGLSSLFASVVSHEKRVPTTEAPSIQQPHPTALPTTRESPPTTPVPTAAPTPSPVTPTAQHGDFVPSKEQIAYWGKQIEERLANKAEILAKWPEFGEQYSNLAKWDKSRHDFCTKQIQDDSPFNRARYPQYTTNDTELQRRGEPVGGLPFNPAVVREHFQKFKNRLIEYYEGTQEFFDHQQPNRAHHDREVYMQKLAGLFASKIVHGKPLLVGAMGTSVMAGTDNCFHYSFAPVLERSFAPLLKTVGVDWVVRGSGQDGHGVHPEMRYQCSNSIVGNVDILFHAYPMVAPPSKESLEVYLRRWLNRGTIVQMWEDFALQHPDLVPYISHGVGYYEKDYIFGQLATVNNTFPWWPPLGRAHWHRPGDGHCHMWVREVDSMNVSLASKFETGMIMINWHPGPLGVQVLVDGYLWTYTNAVLLALDKIQAELARPHSGLARLKQKWPLDRSLLSLATAPGAEGGGRDLNTLPPVVSKNCIQNPHFFLCNADRFDYACATGQKPNYAPSLNLSDWFVNQSDPIHPFPEEDSTWNIDQVKSIVAYSDKLGPNRSLVPFGEDCNTHQDIGFAYYGTGVVTFKLHFFVDESVPAADGDSGAAQAVPSALSLSSKGSAFRKGDVWLCQYEMNPDITEWSTAEFKVFVGTQLQPNLAANYTDGVKGCLQVVKNYQVPASDMDKPVLLTIKTKASTVGIGFIIAR